VAERVLAGAVKMVLRDPTLTAAKLMEQNEHERKSTLGIFLKIETLSCTVFLKYRAGIMSRNAPVTCRIISMKYGYARVSTDESIDAQVRQLKAAGARAGDVLFVTRLDRYRARPLEHPRGDRRRGCWLPTLGNTWATPRLMLTCSAV
jgi:uncharacterized phosphosugar-binding protein